MDCCCLRNGRVAEMMFVIDVWLAVWAPVSTESFSTSNTYYGSRNLACFVLNHVPTRWTYFTADRGAMMSRGATCYVYISFRLSLHKGRVTCVPMR